MSTKVSNKVAKTSCFVRISWYLINNNPMFSVNSSNFAISTLRLDDDLIWKRLAVPRRDIQKIGPRDVSWRGSVTIVFCFQRYVRLNPFNYLLELIL